MRYVLMMMAVAGLGLLFSPAAGCEERNGEGPMERLGERMDDAGQEIGEAVEDAADEVRDAADDAADGIDDEREPVIDRRP